MWVKSVKNLEANVGLFGQSILESQVLKYSLEVEHGLHLNIAAAWSVESSA